MIRPHRAMRALVAAGFATAACAQSQPDVAGRGGVAQPASGTGPTTTTRGTSAGLQLSVQAPREWTYPTAAGSTLFSSGHVNSPFSCRNDAPVAEGAGPAVESG